MSTPRAVILFCVAMLFHYSAGVAAAEIVRDGSSFERAILVPGDYKHSVRWEWDYLHRHFRDRIPTEQALTQQNGRTYDRFVFAGSKVLYFDVTRFVGEIFKKRTKSVEQIMKELGIPIEHKK
jgi:hypothetical protein